jgi:internalin A
MSIARTRIAEEAELRSDSLSLEGLALDALPEELASLTALRYLDCSRTPVSDLSPLQGLTALQYLYCQDTQVSDLSPLQGLTALRCLYCQDTQVSDLSPLQGLTHLRILDCSRCRLRGIPLFIQNQNLHLVAFNTHVPGLPYGVLSESGGDNCLARVRAHFADMAEGTTDLTDVKVLLLGNGGAQGRPRSHAGSQE